MMRKYYSLCSAVALLCCVFMASPAWAIEGYPASMVVIDKDPKGTNLRATPDKKGAIVAVLPSARPGGKPRNDGTELLTVYGQSVTKGWIKVTVLEGGGKGKDVQGYMHTSVLGTCAGATEEGPASWNVGPSDNSKSLGRMKMGEPLQILAIEGVWVQVRRVTGDKGTGWTMAHALAGALGELEECVVAWGKR